MLDHRVQFRLITLETKLERLRWFAHVQRDSGYKLLATTTLFYSSLKKKNTDDYKDIVYRDVQHMNMLVLNVQVVVI